MWFAPAIALGGAISLVLMATGALGGCPAILGPLAGRALDRLVDQPAHRAAGAGIEPEQLAFLRHIARKTWHFFETFVTAQENWLPPDNFQEEPRPTVAARTSPTNIGLALLANLAARDFGYLSLGRLLERTQATIDTMQRLERHRGHFYNWYETRTLQPLLPLYVSSVDSGNLAGHLLTLASGLRGLADEKILDPQIFAGLRDTLALVQGLTGENAAFIATRCRTGEDAVQSACGRDVVTTRGGTSGEDFRRAGESRRRFKGLGADVATQLRGAFGRTEFPCALAEG